MTRHDWQRVDGILLLDKSPGMSSNIALQKARRLFRAKKGGHTGSLDPIASGLLPLCFGEATKLSGFLLHSDKRYQTRIRLGLRTTTADREGEAIESRPVPPLTEALIESALERLRGDILQVPPMHSALKRQGQRLYDLARKGVEVEREARPVRIYELKLDAFGDDCLDLDIHCSKGTYIRSLAEDLGELLGCGGHVENLRRTAVGELDVRDAATLTTLEELPEADREKRLLPMDCIVTYLPEVRVTAEMARYVRQGQAIRVPRAPSRGWVRIYCRPDTFLGLGEVLDDGRIGPRRVVAAPPADAPQSP